LLHTPHTLLTEYLGPATGSAQAPEQVCAGTENAVFVASMTTQPLHHGPVFADRSTEMPKKAEAYIALLGRVLFSAVFIAVTPEHFSGETIRYAASHGVPLADVLVPASGILALLGGLSVLTGFKARIGAWLLVLFLVPVTIMMHNFWAISDPTAARMQQVMFMKNLGLLGAALLVAYFGAGPASIDHFTHAHSERTSRFGRI
jgi:putative oxidoreductase